MKNILLIIFKLPDYEVLIAGGSISGLLAAREIAAGGISVAVLEEDSEIGTPEHCGGLVSIAGIRNLGVVPDASTVQNNKIKRAKISSPSNFFEIDAEKQNVMVLDRRALDKQIAFQAQRNGAEIRVKCSMRSLLKDSSNYVVRTTDGDLTCKYFVDAKGVSSIISRSREGVLQSAQYEVFAPWIDSDTIEVKFDSEKYPGFFAWIIPTGKGKGKVGVAGRHINAGNALRSYIDSKGKCSIVRKIYASIWVKGPLQNFVFERMLIVGDAAGQSKPTTAGGIYSCGMGGLLAGKAVLEEITAMRNGESRRMIEQYETSWFSLFKSEFEKMLLARRLLERLDNKALDQLVSSITPKILYEASTYGDFDFHTTAIAKMLGSKVAAKIAKALLGNELRKIL